MRVLAVYASNILSAEKINLWLCVFRVWNIVASIYFYPILRDVSGTIGGRSGDLTDVGRVTRVWVETKWG